MSGGGGGEEGDERERGEEEVERRGRHRRDDAALYHLPACHLFGRTAVGTVHLAQIEGLCLH